MFGWCHKWNNNVVKAKLLEQFMQSTAHFVSIRGNLTNTSCQVYKFQTYESRIIPGLLCIFSKCFTA